jgi:hypothetical protein
MVSLAIANLLYIHLLSHFKLIKATTLLSQAKTESSVGYLKRRDTEIIKTKYLKIPDFLSLKNKQASECSETQFQKKICPSFQISVASGSYIISANWSAV